ERGAVVIYLACDEITSFAALIRPYLDEIPSHCLTPGDFTRFSEAIAALPADFGPRAAAGLLTEIVHPHVIFILDEFDRVSDELVQGDVATFMKLLSDALAPVCVILVGIGRTVSAIIGHHNSLRRHMIAIPVRGIDTEYGREIIREGALKAGLNFTPDAQEMILSLACGSPYHIRLFCLHSGLEAAKTGTNRVELEKVFAGLVIAQARWAMFNPAAATVFAEVVKTNSTRFDILTRLARISATQGYVSTDLIAQDLPLLTRVEIAVAVRGLEPVLKRTGEDADLFQFEDSLAPQFLLMAMARFKAKARHKTPVKTVMEVA
ncbi:MAG: putative ATPase GelJ, partial [Pseudomonadota bacterium]